MARACLDRRAISGNLPAEIMPSLAIQLPPHAATLGSARYWGRFAAVIPPVGMNRTLAKGAENARSVCTPPIASAGENLTRLSPLARAMLISVGVATPGITGALRSSHQPTPAGAESGGPTA